MVTRSKIFTEQNTTLIPNLEAKAPILSQQGGSCTVYSASVAFRLHGAQRIWYSDWLKIWQSSYDAACKKAGKTLDRDSYSNTMKDVFEFYKKLGLCTGFKELTGGYMEIVGQITNEIKAGKPVHFGIGISQIPYELYYTITPKEWKPRDLQRRTHELAIVGFDDKYFYIQNSYGVDNQHAEGKGYFRIEKEIIKYNGFGYCVFDFEPVAEKPVEPTPEKETIMSKLQLPFRVKVNQTQGYGKTEFAASNNWYPNHFHNGLDFGISSGTELVAPCNGAIVFSGLNGGFGGTVVLQMDGNGYELQLSHMKRIDVKQGQRVTAGQLLGLAGGNANDWGHGTSTGAHLHLTVSTNYNVYMNSIDPATVFELSPYQSQKYEAVHKGQKFALVGFQPSIRFTLQNTGTETLIDDTVRLFFRKDKNVVNPSNVDYSVFFAGKDGIKLECIDQASRTYTATIPLNVKIGIPKGVYREDWGLALVRTKEWVTTYNAWFEVEVV